MKTFVDFRSDKFPAYEGEEEDINPGLWGKRLAEYFVEQLPQFGFDVEDIIAEDWGYYLPIANAEPKLAVCCGHQYGDDDEFLCFTEPSVPVARKFLQIIDATEALTKLTSAMEKILTADDDIQDVNWYTPEEFQNPPD